MRALAQHGREVPGTIDDVGCAEVGITVKDVYGCDAVGIDDSTRQVELTVVGDEVAVGRSGIVGKLLADGDGGAGRVYNQPKIPCDGRHQTDAQVVFYRCSGEVETSYL